MWMVGARPVPDALGRVNKIELIPLEELSRPHIDVVVNCSGVFRDLFINQMNLLDQAVKMPAEADAVDNWVYEDTNETFIKDEEMCKRLMDLNPNSFRRMVSTLLEVNGRGYWETSDENLERLQELYQEVEYRIEGIDG